MLDKRLKDLALSDPVVRLAYAYIEAGLSELEALTEVVVQLSADRTNLLATNAKMLALGYGPPTIIMRD